MYNSFFRSLRSFNAKMACLPDFVNPDDDFLNIMNIDNDDDSLNYFFDYNVLTNVGVPLQRNTECRCRPNVYGHRLISLCKRLNLYIANSRLGKDKFVGRKTCNNVSVVDYLLLSSSLFTHVHNFEVEPFNPLYSDVHCNITCFEIEK